MSVLPYLIAGLGLYWCLLLIAAKDNVVRKSRTLRLADAFHDAAARFTRSLEGLTRASAATGLTIAQVGESLKRLAALSQPRIDRVVVADDESLYRFTRQIGTRRPPSSAPPSMFSSSLLGIPVVVSPDIEPGVAVLMRAGKPVGRIDLSHFVGAAGEPPFENGWENA